jgi:hypothetical protein
MSLIEDDPVGSFESNQTVNVNFNLKVRAD